MGEMAEKWKTLAMKLKDKCSPLDIGIVYFIGNVTCKYTRECFLIQMNVGIALYCICSSKAVNP